jgi:hypothetical protein
MLMMNGEELERKFMAYFKVLSQHLIGKTEENHKI